MLKWFACHINYIVSWVDNDDDDIQTGNRCVSL